MSAKVLFFAMVLANAWVIGCHMMKSKYESRIIERGYGLYCPDDGSFAFKGECGQ